MYLSVWLRRLAIYLLLLLPLARFPETLIRFRSGDPTAPAPAWTKVFAYADEASFFIFLSLALTFVCLNPWSFRWPRLPVTKWLLCFLTFGLLMGAVKGVPAAQAAFGLYDITKNLWVLYLFALMKFSREEFLNAAAALVKMGIILALVGLAGVFLAWTLSWGINLLAIESDRLLPFQPISLTGLGSHNYLGVYAVLLFFLSYGLEGELAGKGRRALFPLLVATASRQTWMSFLTVYMFFKRKKFLLVLAPFLFAGVVVAFGSKIQLDPSRYFRLFTFYQSLKLLAAHPLTGVGPGMFGGLASIFWDSPVYKHWPEVMLWYLKRIRCLDLFWPQIWGELGLIGLSLNWAFFASLFFSLRKTATFYEDTGDRQLASLGRALQYFVLALGIMGFAGGFNCAFIVYTYFALVGIYLSLYAALQKGRHGAAMARPS
jgi:hypothetical protein